MDRESVNKPVLYYIKDRKVRMSLIGTNRPTFKHNDEVNKRIDLVLHLNLGLLLLCADPFPFTHIHTQRRERKVVGGADRSKMPAHSQVVWLLSNSGDQPGLALVDKLLTFVHQCNVNLMSARG